MQKDSFEQEINQKINIVKIEDEKYPSLLKKINNPPNLLYYKGDLIKDEICFAIVGTRRCSDYGKEIAFSVAKDLANVGITIVSGMAKGIDAFCHQGALEAGGRTIAVLGTGLDAKSIYPQENLKLAKKILENNGCLISEYPPGTPGLKQNFPQRNRIVSGMSLGVLIVEAKLNSGALITANWAKTQKKKIFAVPGSIYSSNSKGTHWLIKKGAKLIEDAQDILKEFNLEKTIKKQEAKGNNLEQNLILHCLKSGNLSIDKIIEKTKLPIQTVSANLSLLEFEGKIKSLGGNIYTLF